MCKINYLISEKLNHIFNSKIHVFIFLHGKMLNGLLNTITNLTSMKSCSLDFWSAASALLNHRVGTDQAAFRNKSQQWAQIIGQTKMEIVLAKSGTGGKKTRTILEFLQYVESGDVSKLQHSLEHKSVT